MVSKLRCSTQSASTTWGVGVGIVGSPEWVAPTALALQTRKQFEEANQQPKVPTQVEAETSVSDDPRDRCLTSRALHLP